MKRIIVPIETKVRELEGKTLLAYFLARDNHEVVIGNIVTLQRYAPALSADVYLGDSAVLRPWRVPLYKKLRKLGTKVAVHDTEGGLFASEEVFAKRNNEKVLASTDCYLGWGARPLALVDKIFSAKSLQKAVVGNPTFDFAKPLFSSYFANEISEIKETYGDFVLVNTNFSGANHFDPKILQEMALYKPQQKMAHLEALFGKFIEGLDHVIETNQGVNFVIRPHPSENQAYYQDRYSKHRNVTVVHKYSVYPWLHACEFLLHNSCTTGVECILAEKLALSYRPIRSDEFDLFLPNYVSKEVETIEELDTAFADALNNRCQFELEQARSEVLASYIEYRGDLSAQRAAKALSSLSEMLPRPPARSFPHLALEFTKAAGKGVLRLAYSLVFPTARRAKHYLRQKFPFLGIDELEGRLETLKALFADHGSYAIRRVWWLKDVYIIRRL